MKHENRHTNDTEEKHENEGSNDNEEEYDQDDYDVEGGGMIQFFYVYSYTFLQFYSNNSEINFNITTHYSKEHKF